MNDKEKDSQEKKQPHRFSPGNKHWMKRKRSGTHKIWKDPNDFLRDCYKYFQWCDENDLNIEVVSNKEVVTRRQARPYSMQGLVNYLGIVYDTWLRYESDDNYSDFHEVCTHVRTIVEENQLTGAIAGVNNANIVARLLSLADKKSIAVADQRKSIDELFPPIEEIVEGVDLTEEPE